MELHTTKEKEFSLLSRKRITFTIDNDGATPSRKELLKMVAKKLNAPEDLVIIKHIYPQFGSKKSKVIAHLYQERSKLEIFEHGNLIKRHAAADTDAAKQGA